MSFPALNNKPAGTINATPDTGKQQAGPATIVVPLPNIGMTNQANPGTCAKKVQIMQGNALNMNSAIMMSTGDEAGALGGVVSGMIKGEIRFRKGSAKVQIEGSPAVMMTSMTAPCSMARRTNSATL